MDGRGRRSGLLQRLLSLHLSAVRVTVQDMYLRDLRLVGSLGGSAGLDRVTLGPGRRR